MSKMNLLVHLQAYADDQATSGPSLSNFKWHRDMQGIDIQEPNSQSLNLQAGQANILFNGVQATSSDGTTTYDFSLKSGTSNTYTLMYNSGTAPVFKTNRNIGFDTTTQITVTRNAKLATYTVTSGAATSFITAGVLVGDEVRLSSPFDITSQGKFKILAKTSTSFTIENEIASAETFSLSVGSVLIYSTAGVQVGAKIELKSGLSPVTLGTYEITDVYPNKLEMYCLDSLPSESNIQVNIEIYNNSKQFLYIESNTKLSVIINGNSFKIEPFKMGISTKPGIFMANFPVYSASVQASESVGANVFFITAE